MTIDWWTLGFQTVNVAVLIWLLGHFFWKPVAAMIDARQAASLKLTQAAEGDQAKANAALDGIAATRAGFAAEREGILGSAHTQAETAHAARIAAAEAEVAALRSAAEADIEKGSAAVAAAWAERSSDLAIDIAARLAGRLEGAAVEACFLDWLVAEVAKLSAAVRSAASRPGETLHVTTAAPLDPAAQARVAASLGAALGGTPHLTFASDPTLIAGIALHGAGLSIDSSWRADLDRIGATLKVKAAA